jgi:hypothetical protein
MLSFYRQSLIKLFATVQLIREAPYACTGECFQVQESLIKRITYIEQRIRETKSIIAVHLGSLRTARKDVRLSKQKAAEVKAGISHLRSQVDEYKYLLAILREIGDGLAFAYINKWDIKPLSFKQPPGFISGKVGARRERSVWRTLAQQGRVAILNDLTNCLRYGDITLPLPGGKFTVVEIKPSSRQNRRSKRQLEQMEHIVEYLDTDHTDRLYGLDGDVYRMALLGDEVDLRDEINLMIEEAVERGCCAREVETGLIYAVATESGYTSEAVRLLTDGQSKGEVWVAHLNNLDNTAYYPFTLSIRNPQALYAFYEGALSITIALCKDVIARKLQAESLTLRSNDGLDDWVFEVAPIQENDPRFGRVRIGYHLLNRIYAEFLSFQWFFEQLIRVVSNPSLAIPFNDA